MGMEAAAEEAAGAHADINSRRSGGSSSGRLGEGSRRRVGVMMAGAEMAADNERGCGGGGGGRAGTD